MQKLTVFRIVMMTVALALGFYRLGSEGITVDCVVVIGCFFVFLFGAVEDGFAERRSSQIEVEFEDETETP